MWCWSKFRLKYSTILLSSVNSCSSAPVVSVCVCGHWANPCQLLMLGRNWGSAAYWNLKYPGLQFKHRMILGCFRILGVAISAARNVNSMTILAKKNEPGKGPVSSLFSTAAACPSKLFQYFCPCDIGLNIFLQLLQHHWSFVCQRVIHDSSAELQKQNRCRWLFQAVPHVVSCGCPSEDLRPDFFDIRWECRGCVHLVWDWRSKTEAPIMKRGQVREILNTSKSEVIDSFLPVVCSHASIGWPDRARALSHSRAEWPSGKKTPFTRIFWTLCRFVRLQTQQRNQRKITVDASFLLSKPFLLLHC